jgi:serine/threonine protein kinase
MPIEILEQLGEGSYGTVSRVKWNGQTFAMKKVNDDELGMVSVQEIDIMRSIDHPNILKAEKIYMDDSSTTIFMKVADGPLHRYPFQTQTHLEYMTFQMLQALAFLETMGIIHGDIKTNNFLFFNDDANDDINIKLADFSLSSRSYGGAHHPLYKMYCSVYRPIESWFRKTTTLSDVWALGCCFFELLTRDSLFCDQSHDELYIVALDSFCKKTGQEFPSEYQGRMEIQRKRIENLYEQGHNVTLKVRKWDEMWAQIPNFVRKMLVVDPKKRSSASELLKDPCFEAFRQKIFHSKTEIVLQGKIVKHTTRRNTAPIQVIKDRFMNTNYHTVTKIIALDLFSKCLHMATSEQETEDMINACTLLSIKLTEPSRYTQIYNMTGSKTDNIFKAEKKICQTLNYILYPEIEELFNMTPEEIKMFYS